MSGHKNKTSLPTTFIVLKITGRERPASGTFPILQNRKKPVSNHSKIGRNFLQEEPFVEIRSSKDERQKVPHGPGKREEESTLSYSEKIKLDKERNIAEKGRVSLSRDNWKARTAIHLLISEFFYSRLSFISSL
jgi:hypothetical protein